MHASCSDSSLLVLWNPDQIDTPQSAPETNKAFSLCAKELPNTFLS
jgi:hypothetical protein